MQEKMMDQFQWRWLICKALVGHYKENVGSSFTCSVDSSQRPVNLPRFCRRHSRNRSRSYCRLMSLAILVRGRQPTQAHRTKDTLVRSVSSYAAGDPHYTSPPMSTCITPCIHYSAVPVNQARYIPPFLILRHAARHSLHGRRESMRLYEWNTCTLQEDATPLNG